MCAIVALLITSVRGQETLYEFDPASGAYNTSHAAPDVNFRYSEGDTWTPGDEARPFSTSSMAPGGSYTGPDFFGGFSADSASGFFGQARVRHDPNIDGTANRRAELVFQDAYAGDPGSTTFFFGAEIAATALKDIHQVKVTGGRTSRANGPHTIHLGVEVDGKWYVGDKIGSTTDAGIQRIDFTFAELDTTAWFPYDPEKELLVQSLDGDSVILPPGALISRLGVVSTITWDDEWGSIDGGGQLTNLISFLQITGFPASKASN